MLVLTRRPGEALLIRPDKNLDPSMTVTELFKDGPILVSIQDIKPNQVRIGIEASRAFAVVRDELNAKD